MSTNKYTIDRFEGELAVLLLRENEAIEKVVPIVDLGDVSEGDLLLVTMDEKGKVLRAEVLKEETELARQEARELLEQIKKMNE